MIGVPRQLATAEQGPIPGPLARPAQQRSALIRAHAEHPYTSWQRALKKPRRISPTRPSKPPFGVETSFPSPAQEWFALPTVPIRRAP